ncbi:GNAT family N-acetyltransferase [Chloroflexota bacterium]
MLQVDIRYGTAEDAKLITEFIRSMVTEMALYGGHAVNDSPEAWSSIAELVKANSIREDYIYLIASYGSPVQKTVGIAEANLESLDNIFAAKKRLHISAVYTDPNVRRQGIARQLIQKALEWGRCMNAEEANLNVLAANPSRQLYEHLGFQPHEISMVIKLDR